MTYWKTEYAVRDEDGDESGWTESKADAFEDAQRQSVANPDALFIVVKITRNTDDRDDIGSFEGGIEMDNAEECD